MFRWLGERESFLSYNSEQKKYKLNVSYQYRFKKIHLNFLYSSTLFSLVQEDVLSSVSKILCFEMQKWVQKLCGYCSTFQTKYEMFVVMVGEDGGNGKTVLKNLMTHHLTNSLVAQISPAVVFSCSIIQT